MIIEHAMLVVKQGQAKAFEAAIGRARGIIASSPGFIEIEVRPSVETSGRYLLRVCWTDVEAHREGFRSSDRYQEWKALLHHFYEPFPVVEYFEASII
jgi:heme-degrading monooxygenase HmoA